MWRLVEIRAASADIKHFHSWANTESWSSTSSVPFSRTIGSTMLGLVPKWSWRALLFVFQNSFCAGAVFWIGNLEMHDIQRAKSVQVHNLIHFIFTTGLPKMLDKMLRIQNFTFRQLPSSKLLPVDVLSKNERIRDRLECARLISDDKPGIGTLTAGRVLAGRDEQGCPSLCFQK